MAKFYDPNTGNVTDYDPRTAQGPSGVPSGGAQTSGGTDMSSLQKMLGMYALSKGNPTGAWSILSEQSETAEMRNRKALMSPAKAAVQKALQQKYTKTGVAAWPEIASIKYLGGMGVRQSLIKQHQTFELLKQNVVRALQGARMSDADMEMAKGYIPSVSDTPETIKTKLNGLNEFLEALTVSGPAQ